MLMFYKKTDMDQEIKEDDWRFKSELFGDFKDWRYLEWKYFSFDSPEAQGFFCYSVGNPKNILGLRKQIISYAIYQNGKRESGMFESKKKHSNLSDEKKWIFGNFSIQKKENSWIISGTSKQIDWELTFECMSKGKKLEVFEKEKKKRWMDWEVFCNHANVVGSINIPNKRIEIVGDGYYDSNLGHWKPAKNPWIWFQFTGKLSDKDLSFTLFKPRKTGEKCILLSLDGETYQIEDFILEYDKEKNIPQSYKIISHSENIDLELQVEVKDTELLTIKVFKFIPLLHLNLLMCDFDLNIDFFGQSDRFKTRGFGEYPGSK